MKKLRIAFMGTPDFAVTALRALCEGAHDVVCVYSQPPRPKGRGHKVQPSPVQAYAESQGIPVYHPKSLKSSEQQEIFAGHNLDIAVVAAYGLLLPKAILETPKHGCINIHASLLPRWRGASPIQHAIWEGDETSGVTIMQMDEGLDTGPEIMKRAVPITRETTASILHDALAALGAEMTTEALDILAHTGTLESTPQNDTQSTYAPLLKKEDGRIDWNRTAEEIDRQIRALNPWPGVYTGEGDNRLKILTATPLTSCPGGINQTYRPVGMLLDKQGHIACGDDTILQIHTLQPAGKKPMDFASALNGSYVKIGDTLA